MERAGCRLRVCRAGRRGGVVGGRIIGGARHRLRVLAVRVADRLAVLAAAAGRGGLRCLPVEGGNRGEVAKGRFRHVVPAHARVEAAADAGFAVIGAEAVGHREAAKAAPALPRRKSGLLFTRNAFSSHYTRVAHISHHGTLLSLPCEAAAVAPSTYIARGIW